MKNTKRFWSLLLALCLAVSMLPGAASAGSAGGLPFTDVDRNAWYYDNVKYVYDKGIMLGTGDGGNTTFSPDLVTTRGMIVSMLYRVDGSPAVSGQSYSDVAQGQWYADAVLWGSAENIVVGYTDNTFRPNDTITREQLASFLYRYTQYKDFDSSARASLGTYADYSRISGYAQDAMSWAVANGLIVGVGGNMLSPGGHATRKEAATILARYFAKYYDTLTLTRFSADIFDIYINQTATVTFTVNTTGSQAVTTGVLPVYDADNHVVAQMRDDGTGGDAQANDGVFTGRAELSSAEVEVRTYHTAYGSAQSNTFDLCFYRDITQDEFSDFAALRDKLSAMSFDEAKVFVATSSEIESFEVDSANRTISYKSTYGIYGLWSEFDSDYKGSGAHAIPASRGVDYNAVSQAISELEFTSAIGEPNITVLRPFHGSDFSYYDDFATAGRLVQQALGGSLNILDDADVTLDAMRSLAGQSLVLIDSHGTRKQNKTPYLLIGEELNEGRFLWDPVYYAMHAGYSADYLSGRIYCTGYRNRLAVGGSFFEKYYSNGSLSNSMWFLGTCYSMHDNSIASALTGRGASAVVGYTQPVSVGYCNSTLYEVLLNSMLLSADTVGVGVSNAKAIYGAQEANGNEMRLYGRSAYRLVTAVKEPAAMGTLSGRICRASDRVTPVAGAQVTITQNGRTVQTRYADANGDYTAELPAGTYLVTIRADGYLVFTSYAVVEENSTTYMETFLMIEGEADNRGVAAGRITNALNDVGIEGVNIAVREGWNNTTGPVIGTFVTNASGDYSIELPLGNYSLALTRNGFIETALNIIVQNGTTNQGTSMSPILSEGSFRIVLTWGENPRDLDSHMVGSLSSGSQFHVYYSHKSQHDDGIEVCSLDHDDTTSYGPETITLNTQNALPYYYYIYHYAGTGTVATSAAHIEVFQGNDLIQTFNVPANMGNGRYWNVFAIVNGRLVISNTITSSPDTSYAG